MKGTCLSETNLFSRYLLQSDLPTLKIEGIKGGAANSGLQKCQAVNSVSKYVVLNIYNITVLINVILDVNFVSFSTLFWL